MATNQSVVRTVLRIESDNLDSLLKGQAIAAISQTFIRSGQHLLICSSVDDSSQEITVDTWFNCVSCYALDDPDALDDASFLTAIRIDSLKNLLVTRGHIFLVKLRGYWLPCSVKCLVTFNGQFGALSQPLSVDTVLPILSDQTFLERDKIQPPKYPELEELYLEASKITRSNPIESKILKDIQLFFGCSLSQKYDFSSSNLDWIKTIVPLSNRAFEENNEKKSNYQAGTDFEEVVRKSLDFLGFQLDLQHQGGAGGLDVFCSKPYSLAVECKAGKKVKDAVVEQLEKIAKNHLGEQYHLCSKLIIMPGKPSNYMLNSSQWSKVSILSPQTLQKLVEIQAKYPNSVDLIKLRIYLKPGITDQSIENYIEEEVLKKLKFYSHILHSISNYFKQNGASIISTKDAIKIYRDANLPYILSDKELHDILIELSSPFAGYLGREKALDSNWIHDRFYYLRDLTVE